MATTLGQLNVGDIVTLNENGIPQNYIIIQQGNPRSSLYDSSCDGTWLLREKIYNTAKFGDNSVVKSSYQFQHFLPKLLSIYDASIAYSIKNVKIPYCVGGGNSTVYSGANGLECKLFLLSNRELDGATSATDGVTLTYFQNADTNMTLRKAKYGNSFSYWWTRSPHSISSPTTGLAVDQYGDIVGLPTTSIVYGVRPAMILPSSMVVNDDNSIATRYMSLGQLPQGTGININENNQIVSFLIGKQNYQSDLNGTGRTLMVRKNTYNRQAWSTNGANSYTSSSIDVWLNSTYKNLLNNFIKLNIGSTNFYYTPDGRNNPTVQTLKRDIFLLSYTELGNSAVSGQSNKEGEELVETQLFGYERQWTRSPKLNNTTAAWAISDNNGTGYISVTNSTDYGARPVFTLPSSLIVDLNNNISTVSFKITVPEIFMEGQPIPILWDDWTYGESITYSVQRNINNTTWETIASDLDSPSYTDTAQSGWEQVQYQIIININGMVGPIFQSNVILGEESSSLAISGIDQNLGTITSNIPYTVVSNTGNSISLSRTVNGIQTTSITIDSGFAYNIPVADLPTGSGIVSITAKVQSSTGEVTKTRTWNYYKTPIIIPDNGGIGQLVQDSQNIWPITLADCVKVPTFFGGTLDKALELIAPAINPTIIAAGSYTGTGQYGQSNPNTLTFTKQPLIVLIYGPNTSLTISSTDTSSTAYISGTTATWYSTESAEAQLNSSGVEYSYVAIATTNN